MGVSVIFHDSIEPPASRREKIITHKIYSIYKSEKGKYASTANI